MFMTKQVIIKIGIVSFILLLIHITTVFSQNNPNILDTSILKCEYKTIYYTDTLAMNKGLWMPDDFILLVGAKVSKYYSKATDMYERVMSDPKAKAAYNKELNLALAKAKNSGGFLEQKPLARNNPLVIYNNYPQNKRTIHDAVFFDYYIFEDDNEPQKWAIVADSVKTILGYKCRKAVCSYRGRDYEAWYAPDISVSAGPWKFSGLPGLIMNVQDTKGHYTFEISGLEKTKEPIEYIEYGGRKYTHIDRLKFLRTNAKASNIGWARYLDANSPKSTGYNKNKTTNSGSKYDLLEKDY